MIRNGLQFVRIKKSVAIVCLIGCIISFGFGESIQAAQMDSAASAISLASPMTIGAMPKANLSWANPAPVVATAATLITITLLAHNLLTSGKQGWGWATLAVFVGVFLLAVRVAVSVFREVSSANSIADWDE